MADADRAVGARVRQLRLWRGMRQQAVAELAGRPQSWLSRVESGRAVLAKITDVEALADALQVHPADLLGQPHRAALGRTWPVEALVPAVRVALIDEPVDAQVRPLAELERRVAGLVRVMWSEGDLQALAAALPELLGDVRLAVAAAADEEDRRRALQLVAVLCSTAFPMLKNLEHVDLALVASTLAIEAAEELDEPLWHAYAGFRRSHALIPAGSPARALAVARHAVDELEPFVVDDPASLRMYGMAHLTAALWASRAGQNSTTEDHMIEARAAAQRVGGDGSWWDITFGPGQVGIHGVGNAARLGEGDRVAELAAEVDTTGVPPVHRAMFAANIGHGHTVAGRGEEAVRSFREAELLAPQRMRTSGHFRSLVADVSRLSLRPAATREWRGLAYRVGIA